MKRKLVLISLLLVCIASVGSAAKLKAKHVVLIGLDGWGAYSVEKAEMPNVKKLMAEGAYTLKKRSVFLGGRDDKKGRKGDRNEGIFLQ